VLRKLPLIHPEALQLSRNYRGFTVRQHSIFDNPLGCCHVLRAMNILNRAYFAEELLAKACRNALDGLFQGGICIIGRTVREDAPEHHATIFRKGSSGQFEVLQRIGSGSEIESIALASRSAV
jgi:hypothetical protein